MATPNIPGTDKQDIKTRSKTSRVLGFFKPDLGTGPTQVREVHGTFLLILATLFASVNILSRDHPYLKAGAQFTLGDLFATTLAKIDWRNKQQLPQTVFFCAVWGLMASMVLYLVTAVLLFVATPSHAYAQEAGASGPTAATSGGMFTLENKDKDLAQQFLHNLVEGKPVDGIKGSNGNSSEDVAGLNNTGPLQGAFRDMLKYYSSVILIIASFMVLYHIIMLIVSSAWSGKPLEGANQIWGPLRLAIAIGLLVPLSNGLNSGQYIVLKAAEVGSVAGTKVWNIFSDSLSKRASAVAFTPSDDLRDVFVRMVLIQTCMYDVDYHSSSTDKWIRPKIDNNVVKFVSSDGFDACGAITLPDPAIESSRSNDGDAVESSPDAPSFTNATFLQGLAGKIREVNHNAANRLRLNAQTIARRLVNFQYFVQDAPPPGSGGPLSDQSPPAFTKTDDTIQPILRDITASIRTYQMDVNRGVQAVIKQYPMKSQLTNTSWILAGAYYLQLAMYQHVVFSAAETSPTAEFGPIFSKVPQNSDMAREGNFASNVQSNEQTTFLKNYQIAYLTPVEQAAHNRIQSSDANDITSEIQDLKSRTAAATETVNDCQSYGNYDPTGIAVGSCYLAADVAAPKERSVLGKIWNIDKFKFISQMSGNSDDPFGTFVTYGQTIFSTGVTAFKAGIGGLIGTATIGLIAPGAAGAAALAGWVITISFYLLSLGVLLCIMLPLVPLTKFLGGIVTWLLAIMEAIIGMPLFALAHLTPGGNGLLDPARQGYVMLFHIALRPMLLVFGMIVSLIVASLALYLLNAMFISTIKTAWSPDDNGIILAIVMFSVWAVIAYQIVKKIFSYMDYISHSTMRWIGGGYQFERYQGESNAFAAVEAFRQASNISQKVIGNVAGLVGKTPRLIGGKKPDAGSGDDSEGTFYGLPGGTANAANSPVTTGGGGYGSNNGAGVKATIGPAGKPPKGQPTSNVTGGNQFGFGGGAVATGSAPAGSTITSIGPNGQAQPKPGQPRGKGAAPAVVGLGMTAAALGMGMGGTKAEAATPGFVRGAPTEQLRMNEMDAGKPTESGDPTGGLSMTGAKEPSPKLGLPEPASAQDADASAKTRTGINPGMIGAQGVSGSTAATGGIGDTRATSPRLGLSGAGTVAGSMAQQVAGLNFNRTQDSGGTRLSGASPVSNAAAPATGQGAAARPSISGGAATGNTPQQTAGLGFNRSATDTADASGLAGAGYTAGSVTGSVAGGVPVGVAPASVSSASSSSLQNAGAGQGAAGGSTAQQFFARDGAPSATYGSQAAEAGSPLSSLAGAAPAAEMNIAPTSAGITASTPAPAPAGSGQSGGYADFNAPNTIANAAASPLVGGGSAPASFGATSQGTASVGPAMPMTPDVANAYSTLNLAPTATQAEVSAAYQTMVTQNQSALNAAPEGSLQYAQATSQAQQLAQANNTLINNQGAGSAWLAQPITTAPSNTPATKAPAGGEIPAANTQPSSSSYNSVFADERPPAPAAAPIVSAPAAMTPVVEAPTQPAPQPQVNVASERDNQGRAQGATITTPANSAANPAAPVVAEGRRRNIEPASLRDRTAQNQTDPKKPKDS